MPRTSRTLLTWICLPAFAVLLRPLPGTAAVLEVTEMGDARDTATLEFHGVGAGSFAPELWVRNELNWVPDIRRPLLGPREGACRNIYAPSAVESEEGWKLLYGGWDGAPSCNDRIYLTTTSDFLEFGNPGTLIEHGGFQHICNVNALGDTSSGLEMVCTVYPDQRGLNKPAYFQIPMPGTGSSTPGPLRADLADIARVTGYALYDEADINGMNVILRESDSLRLYFSSFKDFGKVYRASRRGAGPFEWEGVALEERLMVNDVKRFSSSDGVWYLMGLHRNGGQLRYALSRDGLRFQPTQQLFPSSGPEEKFIVALGWVVKGEQERADRRLLGVLYGAGEVASLDRNRIFARWLQKQVVVSETGGKSVRGAGAFGPDRQLLEWPAEKTVSGTVELLAEDGRTLLGKSEELTLRGGKAYQVTVRH